MFNNDGPRLFIHSSHLLAPYESLSRCTNVNFNFNNMERKFDRKSGFEPYISKSNSALSLTLNMEKDTSVDKNKLL